MPDTTVKSNPDRAIRWYRQMLEIRAFEERVQELFAEGLIAGSSHLCQGQEAVSVGMIEALRPSDYLTITYRGHGHALARGMSFESAFGEMLGRSTGCCGGVGGSMHLTDASLGLLGAFAIVGASYPVALGAAMTAKLTGTESVAMAFCGDGATNIGTFHESLNMAAVWNAPVVFVIENNLYAEYTPLAQATAITDLARRADGYGMPGVSVDGQDVDETFEAAAEAVERARTGGGPTLIEAKTYRFRGHSRTDPAKYRPDGELEAWKLRDPISLLGNAIEKHGVATKDELEETRAAVVQLVDAAASSAIAAPYPTMEEIRNYVYSN